MLFGVKKDSTSDRKRLNRGSMNIGFVFTNFNNSTYTRAVIASIEGSPYARQSSIVVVDNQSNADDIALLKQIESDYPNIKVIYNQENVGYFKGLNTGIRHLKQTGMELEFIIVGNNDLVFPNDFFDCINQCRPSWQSYAVISPDLITLDGVHQNPHVRHQISRFREFIWDVYYSNYQVSRLIQVIARLTKRFSERKDFTSHTEPGVIYQGYGACYILTPLFFEHFTELWAPGFLMGEEFFLWKQTADKGQKIFYEPRVSVQHHDHATTDKVPGEKLWNIYRESHLIYKKYKV